MSPDLDQIAKQCRAAIAQRIAASTAAEYVRVATRLAHASLDEIGALPKASRRVAVAARKRHLAAQLLEAFDAKRENTDLVLDWLALQQRFPAPAKNALAAAFARQMAAPSPTGNRRRSKSKKQTLAKLPRDWRQQVLTRMGSLRSRHLSAIAVMEAAGLRPEELRRGVVVTRQADGAVSVHLESAKSRFGKSHSRTITVEPTQSTGAALLARALDRVPQIRVCAPNKMALTNALRRAGQKLFQLDDLTPYCFRHAFSADLKRSGSAGVDIARALGHANDGLVPRYGAAAQGTTRKVRTESTREPTAEQAQQIARLRARDKQRSRSR